jgi:inorganic triphosphatase YgiF
MGERGYVEIERKYDVAERAAIPSLIGFGPVAAELAPQTAELEAVYFDTDALSLAHRSIALRRREGGSDAGWHIKLPGDEGRTELHWPLGSGSQVPDAVRDAVREYVGDQPLVPIARVRNTRATTVLVDPNGRPIAEVCDDRVRSQNLREGGERSWREWEVELREGAAETRLERTALLDVIERQIVSAGARPSASSSKLAKALGMNELR